MTPRVLHVGPDSRAASIAEAARALQAGSLVIFPTETVYGLAAHPAIPSALDRLYEAKGRDRRKPVPLLAFNVESAEEAGVRFDAAEQRVAAAFWPGPLTLIVAAGDGDEGLRIPDHDIARELLLAAGGTLRATSANRSNQPAAGTAEEAIAALAPFVDAVLDGGPIAHGIASTVAKVRGGDVEILRQGQITRTQLVECLDH